MADGTSSTVTALVSKLHANIDRIHACIASLSDTSKHDVELERLSEERETRLAVLHATYRASLTELLTRREGEQKDVEERRQREEEQLEAERKRELDELTERRRREDEDRERRYREEETAREQVRREEDARMESERQEKEKALAEDVEVEMERLEDEIERMVEAGKARLRGLDEERRNINADIERALSAPTTIPSIQFRSRAKTGIRTRRDEEDGVNRRFTWNVMPVGSSREQDDSSPESVAVGRRRSQGAEAEQADAELDIQRPQSTRTHPPSTQTAPDGERQSAGSEDEQFKALPHAESEGAASKSVSTTENGRPEGAEESRVSEGDPVQDSGENPVLSSEKVNEGHPKTVDHETGSQGDVTETPPSEAVLDGSRGPGSPAAVDRLAEPQDEAVQDAARHLSGEKPEDGPQDLDLKNPDIREELGDGKRQLRGGRTSQSEAGSLTERVLDEIQDASVDGHMGDVATRNLQVDTGGAEKSVPTEDTAISFPSDNNPTKDENDLPLETAENKDPALRTSVAEHQDNTEHDPATLHPITSTPGSPNESPMQAQESPESPGVRNGDKEMASGGAAPVVASLDSAVETKSEDEVNTTDTDAHSTSVVREDVSTGVSDEEEPGAENLSGRGFTAAESASIPNGEIQPVEAANQTGLDKDETPSPADDHGGPDKAVESKESHIQSTDTLCGREGKTADPSPVLNSIAKDVSPESETTLRKATDSQAQAAASSQTPVSRSGSRSPETGAVPDPKLPSQSINMHRPSSKAIYMRHSRLLSTDSVQSVQSEEEIFLSNASRVRASKSIEDLYPELQIRNLDVALDEGDEGLDDDPGVDGVGGSLETLMGLSGQIESPEDSGKAGDGKSNHGGPGEMGEAPGARVPQQSPTSAEPRPVPMGTSEPFSLPDNDVSGDSLDSGAQRDYADDQELTSVAAARAPEELPPGSPEPRDQVSEVVEPRKQEDTTDSMESSKGEQTPTSPLEDGHSPDENTDTVDKNSEHAVLEADLRMDADIVQPESIQSAIQGASALPEAVEHAVSSSTPEDSAEVLSPSGGEESSDSSVALEGLDPREVENPDAMARSVGNPVSSKESVGHSSREVAPPEESDTYHVDGAGNPPENQTTEVVDEDGKDSTSTASPDSGGAMEQQVSPEPVDKCEEVQGDVSIESAHPAQVVSYEVGSSTDAKSEGEAENILPEGVDEQNTAAPLPVQVSIPSRQDGRADTGSPAAKARHAKPSLDWDSASLQPQLEGLTPDPEFAAVLATPLPSSPIPSSDSLIMDELESQKDMLPVDDTACRSALETQQSVAGAHVPTQARDEGSESANLPELQTQEKPSVTIGEDHSDSFKDLNTLVEKHSVSLGRSPDEDEEKAKGYAAWPLPAAGTLAVDTPRRQASPSNQDDSQRNRDAWITAEGKPFKSAAPRLAVGEAWPLQDALRQVQIHDVEVHAGGEHVAQQAVSETASELASDTDSEGEWSGENEYEQEVRSLEAQRNIGSLRPRLGAELGHHPGRPGSWLGGHSESPEPILADDASDGDADSASEDHGEDGLGTSYLGEITDHYLEQAETPLEVVPEHEPLNEFNDTTITRRSSGLLAKLVDAIRSDMPAVRQLQHVESPDEGDSPEPAPRAPAVSFERPKPDDAQSFPPQDESARSRSHTADTVPSFASDAQSESIPTTPSDTESNLFIQPTHGEPAIQTSWPGSDLESSPPQPPRYEPSKEPGFSSSLASALSGHTSQEPNMKDLEGIEEGYDLFPRETKQAWPTSNAGFSPMGAQTGLEAHRAQLSPARKNTFGVSSSTDPSAPTANPAHAPDNNAPHHPVSSSPGPTRAPTTPRRSPTTPPPLPLHRAAAAPRTTSRPYSTSPTSQISPFPVSPTPSPGRPRGSSSPGSLFAKRRSVFEAASPQGSPGLAPSPITALSATRGPVRRPGGSRPSSLYVSEKVKESPDLGRSVAPAKGSEDGGVEEGGAKPILPKDCLGDGAGDDGKRAEEAKVREEGEDEGDFMPRSLDGDNKPPSPVFSAHPALKVGERAGSLDAPTDADEDLVVAKKRGSVFLGGLSRFVGGGERGSVTEPLLRG
ncbi:hypothetical protein B2J93_7033 [Marssonina coronariae]|uniref:Uncharacterized protein n=1 Tax=Diplocarpon coronariae TaxID=2795749 RepID=A0A218Z0C3_9HELO|nr:hypothetical protein B2J93_7033 [Marssonina coronariae]